MRQLVACVAGLVVIFSASIAAESDLAEQYRATANRLIDAALADSEGYAKLAYLCDRIGNRLSGSAGLEKAIAWAADQMRRDGLSEVRLLPVKVPHWVRGPESGSILSPVPRPLHMLGLGMSVGTPAGGITAETVAVRSFEELEMLGREKVQGKIVVYYEPWEGYDKARVYRGSGASRAAALGAVAALIRSATPLAMQVPHTGAMNYAPDQPKIPAAAISVEDAAMIWRLYYQGISVRIHLEMGAHMEPDADSADVIGEIPGRELPGEVVVMGGHIDSWDVGQGAQDDGAGMLAPYQAAVLIKKLGLRPRRTIRVVFWVNEENGGRGALAYRDWLGDKVRSHVAAIEMDGGAETPRGVGFSGSAASLDLLQHAAVLLDRIGAGRITTGGSEADTEPLLRLGVPGLNIQTTAQHYFDWHHSQADTLDKVDPEDFRKNVAALAVMAYLLADMPERLSGTSQ
jgi:carboxypeptidase Q